MNPLVDNDSDDEDHDKFSALLDDVDILLSSSHHADIEYGTSEEYVDVDHEANTPITNASHSRFAHILQHLAAAADVLSEQDPMMSAKVSLRLANEASEMLREYIQEAESHSKLGNDNGEFDLQTGSSSSLTSMSNDIFKIIAEYLPAWDKVVIGLTSRGISKMLIGSNLDLTENHQISSRATSQAILYHISPYRLHSREDHLLNSLCTCAASQVFQLMDVGSSLCINHKSDLYIQTAPHEENNVSLSSELSTLQTVGFRYRWNITGLPLLEKDSSSSLLQLLHRIHSKEHLQSLQVGPKAKLILNSLVQAYQAGLIPHVTVISYYQNNFKEHHQFLGSLSALSFCGRNLLKLVLCDFRNAGMAKVSGDVSSLKSCILLRSLFIGGEHVHGQLSDLCELNALQELGVCCSHVEGSLAPLTKLRSLRLLDLSYSKVTGVLDPLADMKTLEFISVINTKLEGSLTSIGKLETLEYFLVAKTLINRRQEARTSFTRLNPNCEVDITQYVKSPLFERKYWEHFNLV